MLASLVCGWNKLKSFQNAGKVADMLLLPTNSRKVFRVAVYNRDVRSAVKNNQSHPIYGDRWADPQNQDVMASDKDEALCLIDSRYPSRDGFVIQQLLDSETKS